MERPIPEPCPQKEIPSFYFLSWVEALGAHCSFSIGKETSGAAEKLCSGIMYISTMMKGPWWGFIQLYPSSAQSMSTSLSSQESNYVIFLWRSSLELKRGINCRFTPLHPSKTNNNNSEILFFSVVWISKWTLSIWMCWKEHYVKAESISKKLMVCESLVNTNPILQVSDWKEVRRASMDLLEANKSHWLFNHYILVLINW